MTRSFIAIPIPEGLRATLTALVDELRAPMARTGMTVRWVEPAQMHLTLKFLGDQPEPTLDALRQQLADTLAGCQATELEAVGLSAFPSLRNPRVIWVGVVGSRGALPAVVDAVERAASAVGIEREKRPFQAHLTIGRVKQGRASANIGSSFAKLGTRLFGSFEANSVLLYASERHPDGARHTQLERFALAPRN